MKPLYENLETDRASVRANVRNWKPVKGYKGLYEVSSDGDVRKLVGSSYRQLKQHVVLSGYLRVNLRKRNKQRPFLVHRLVARAFLVRPTQWRTQVNHKDGDKQNNSVENLEWVTPKQNQQHASRRGLLGKDALYLRPVRCPQTRFIYENIWEAAEHLNLSPKDISAAVKYQREDVEGYEFRKVRRASYRRFIGEPWYYVPLSLRAEI